MDTTAATKAMWDGLTPREQEVLGCLLDGYMNKEIAHELRIAMNSVSQYKMTAYRKLGITTAADLSEFAIRTGIIEA